MGFCPNCEAEYKEGIKECVDCGIELVPRLTEAVTVHDNAPGEPVKLRYFKTSAEAQMVTELLESNGIRTFVGGGVFSAFPGSFSDQIVVMVDERDLSRAIEIYEAYFDSDTAPTSEDKTENAR